MNMAEPVAFQIPKKPTIQEKDPLPDQRKFVVIPIRAAKDKQLTIGMLQALLMICGYMNRSGITWVGQTRLAKEMGVTQQAVSKHLVKLTKAGYLEVIRRPVPGAKMTTWRVIFDPSISAEDAVAITSRLEDTRPPYMIEEQARQAEQADLQGQRRIAQMLQQAIKKPPTRSKTMPTKGDTRTVREMKKDILKAKGKGTHAQPLEVVQPQPVDNSVHAQPVEHFSTTSGGCIYHKDLSIYKTVLDNLEVEELIAEGLSSERIADCLETLLPLYAAEGITPSSHVLIAGIRQLAADTR